MKKKILFTILFFLLLIISVIIFFGIGIYIFNFRGPVSRFVERIVPYPVALVDFRVITFRELNQRIKINFRNNFSEEQVLSGLIYEEIIEKEAKTKNIQVSKREIDSATEQLLPQGERRTEAIDKIKKLFGISFASYKKQVIEPEVRKEKLFIVLGLDTPEKQEEWLKNKLKESKIYIFLPKLRKNSSIIDST